jgi:hypothetical protein
MVGPSLPPRERDGCGTLVRGNGGRSAPLKIKYPHLFQDARISRVLKGVT